MRIIKKIVKKMLRIMLGFLSISKLNRLRKLNIPVAEKIARAMDETLNNHLSPEEEKWVDKIEELRKRLINSSMTISITDYGAGSSNIRRTEKESDKGVVALTTIGKVCKASKPYFWALFLSKLVREFEPLKCIELGTCLGVSAAYLAFNQKLVEKGSIVTLEGSESLAFLAKENLDALGLENATVVFGKFQDTLDMVLDEHQPIDFAFIDGHHDEEATIIYFQQLQPYLQKESIVIFDDISWSRGMRNAWKKIRENEKVKISLDLRIMGICVLDSTVKKKYIFNIPLI
jgi:precorrin-6B methylase 2